MFKKPENNYVVFGLFEHILCTPVALLISLHLRLMKWCIRILVAYLLALSLVPCSDSPDRCEATPEAVETGSHGHSGDDSDHCSPFCACACCGISVVARAYHFPALEPPFQLKSSQEVVIHDSFFVSSYLGNIWEPPRASC